MIDFHTHILPGLDDGSKSVEESIKMLDSMKTQGIDKVVATPHFYANYESVDDFIKRRDESYILLEGRQPDGLEIFLGAEVRYYDGISHLPDLKKLRIGNSKLLLIEMPFSQWTEYAVRELIDIAVQGNVIPVLAHIERYLQFQKKYVLTKLFDSGILFQANANFFIGRFSRHKAIKMINNNQIHFIGSDCHNLSERAPNTAKAYSVIQNKFGEAFVNDFINYGNQLFL